MSTEEVSAILHWGTSGVLTLPGGDDYSYAVPISYVFDGAKLYFHCTEDSHKLDAIQRNSKTSSCIIDQDQIVPKKYTAYSRSVIAFGQVRIIQNEKEKRVAIERLVKKYSSDKDATGRRKEIDQEWKTPCIPEMYIDHMTGKKAMDLCQYLEKLKVYTDFSNSPPSFCYGVI